jgi:hypothetical protein
MSVNRTNPRLWESVKRSVRKSAKGGLPGTWSARKAQLSVALYKKKGGGYRGKKSPSNSLVQWTKQDWGYIDDGKSGRKKSSKKGRYLPLSVRRILSPSEKMEENRRKGSRRGKRVPYSPSVRRKVSRATRKIR